MTRACLGSQLFLHFVSLDVEIHCLPLGLLPAIGCQRAFTVHFAARFTLSNHVQLLAESAVDLSVVH